MASAVLNLYFSVIFEGLIFNVVELQANILSSFGCWDVFFDFMGTQKSFVHI